MLRAEEKSIKAHKLVLASASPYFRAMFTGGFKETHMNTDDMRLDQICTYSILESIVEFMYTGECVIRESNAQHLLIASKILQVSELENACCMFLYLNIDTTNCIGFHFFARDNGCMLLAE
jgi:hypothetical protein